MHLFPRNTVQYQIDTVGAFRSNNSMVIDHLSPDSCRMLSRNTAKTGEQAGGYYENMILYYLCRAALFPHELYCTVLFTHELYCTVHTRAVLYCSHTNCTVPSSALGYLILPQARDGQMPAILYFGTHSTFPL